MEGPPQAPPDGMVASLQWAASEMLPCTHQDETTWISGTGVEGQTSARKRTRVLAAQTKRYCPLSDVERARRGWGYLLPLSPLQRLSPCPLRHRRRLQNPLGGEKRANELALEPDFRRTMVSSSSHQQGGGSLCSGRDVPTHAHPYGYVKACAHRTARDRDG